MSLVSILSDAMTCEQLRRFAGKQRSKGAKTKEELLHATLLALTTGRDNGTDALPAAAQQKLKTSPVAQRELKRICQAASGGCKTWKELQNVLERFPPSILLQILNDEMTVAQMKAMAGKTRSAGAAIKDELVYAVLLAMAERGAKAMRDLPASAQTRIEAAPAALEWVKMVERADADQLEKLGSWSAFRDLLCTPRGADEGKEDDGEAEESDEDDDDDEDEVEDDLTEGDAAEGEDDTAASSKTAAAAAKVAELEAKLAEAKAELQSTAKATRTRSRSVAATAALAKKKLYFADDDEKKNKSKKAGAVSPVPLWMSFAEVVLTFLLPFVLVLAVIGGKLPGKPGDDLKLHKLAL